MVEPARSLLRQSSGDDVAKRPYEPEFRAAQRGRLICEYVEQGQAEHFAERGWIRLDGPWVHFFGDESATEDNWQSWPIQHVVAIDWDKIEEPRF